MHAHVIPTLSDDRGRESGMVSVVGPARVWLSITNGADPGGGCHVAVGCLDVIGYREVQLLLSGHVHMHGCGCWWGECTRMESQSTLGSVH